MSKHNIALSPLCFLHIPKTGGITLRYVIFNNYRRAKSYTIESVVFTDRFLNLSLANRMEYEVVQGHFTFSDKFAYNSATQFYVMLREPVKRILSHYNFLYSKKEHPFHKEITTNNYSLKEMLTQGYVKNFDNCQVRFLSGNTSKKFGDINESDLQLALYNFDKYFSHFGIVEYFDESLLLLTYELNWKFPYYTSLNETKTKKLAGEIDTETKQLVEHNSRFDKLLYNHALAKFEQKLHRYESRIKTDLVKLHKGNESKKWLLKLDFMLNKQRILR